MKHPQKTYALLGLLAPILFVLTYLIVSNGRPEYSHMTKAVSELGSLDVKNRWVFNLFGYIIPGLMVSLFGYGLFQYLKENNSNKWPLIGIVGSGLFMALAGIFPGDFEDRYSTTMILHSIGSVGSYVFFLIGAFTFPRLMNKISYWNNVRWIGLTITWLSIVCGNWIFIFPEIPGVGQRIGFGIYFFWIGLHAYFFWKSDLNMKS